MEATVEENDLKQPKIRGQSATNVLIHQNAQYIVLSSAALLQGVVLGWGAFSRTKYNFTIQTNGTAHVVEPTIKQWSYVLSSNCLFVSLAAIIIVYVISKFGIRKAMVTTIASSIVGLPLAWFANNLAMLLAASPFLGYVVGGIAVICPLHIEGIEDDKRKRISSIVFQLFSVFGIAFAYVLGYANVNVLIPLCCLPLISYGFAIPSIPNLPARVTTSISSRSLLKRGVTTKSLKSSILAILSQLGGIYLFILHAEYIFYAAHMKENIYWAVAISATGLFVGTIVSSAISYKWRRRGLHITASIMMTIINFGLGAYFNVSNENSEHVKNEWVVVILIWCSMLAFAFGYGLSPWFMLDESVLLEIKVLCVSFNWLVASAVIISFPYVVGAIGIGMALFPLSVFSIANALYVGCVRDVLM